MITSFIHLEDTWNAACDRLLTRNIMIAWCCLVELSPMMNFVNAFTFSWISSISQDLLRDLAPYVNNLLPRRYCLYLAMKNHLIILRIVLFTTSFHFDRSEILMLELSFCSSEFGQESYLASDLFDSSTISWSPSASAFKIWLSFGIKIWGLDSWNLIFSLI